MTIENEAGWNFDNSYSRLPVMFFTRLEPQTVRKPQLVIHNKTLAADLGLNLDEIEPEVFVGNKLPEGAQPLAQAYAGHQFGQFTMLGDGRAILLGEQITPSEERFDIQLKGSGRTPYSRGGDGRAALGPMLREYIISEAMHALGIPTTRSLAVVQTGEIVARGSNHPGAILTRVAKSHLRVGTFEYVSQFGTQVELSTLADYTITRHFPNIQMSDDRYLLFLREVVKNQASLISKWQLAGFIHGVMNTDNMAISGETIDYGPCAFLDTYDPETVFSSIDTQGRYKYENQPQMAAWNLARLAETLLPLLSEDEDDAIKQAQEEVVNFWVTYEAELLAGMRAKLGMFDEEVEDEELIDELLTLMQKYKADYTHTFRSLTKDLQEEMDLFASAEFAQWFERWQVRLSRQDKTRVEIQDLMKQHNPAIIPRNHRVEEALEAAEKGDFNVMKKLLKVLQNPYSYTEDQEEYSEPPAPNSCRYQTFCGT